MHNSAINHALICGKIKIHSRIKNFTMYDFGSTAVNKSLHSNET